jgi:hypothetical protein
MTSDETNPLRRLKAEYRQIVLRDEVRETILRRLAEQPTNRATARPARSPRRPGFGRAAWVAVAFAGGVLVAWGLQGRRPARLSAVVSAISGQAFSDGGETRALGPKLPVYEGQRLRTSASGTVATKVGDHVVAVGADSGLVLESLRPQDLRFRLERGSVRLTVAPLGPDGRLRIFAGDLSIEVVGTVFEVRREGDCSLVSVHAGRVHTWFQGHAGEVHQDEERRFCDVVAPPPTAVPTEPSAGGAARDVGKKVAAPTTAPARKLDERSYAIREALTPPPVLPPPASGQPLSDEERRFRDASRARGAASSLALREYLARYPNGTFAEDALFQLIRDSYAAGNSMQVLDDAQQFLRRFQRGSRANEVRLLYVHSSIEMGLPPGQSLDILASLLSRLDSLPRTQQEPATYLAVLAYCGAPRQALCRLWADRYLDRYPTGRYAAEVRRSQMEK